MMIIAQLLVAFGVAWFYYMLAMMMTTYDGFASLILQPIMGAIFAAIAVVLCLLLGLPIRLVATLRQLWRKIWWLPLFLGAVGFVLMIVSWLPPFRQTVHDYATDTQIQTFQPAMALSAWLLSVFAALHFWFPLPSFLRKAQPHDHARA
jgi:hypothetical protein